MQAYVKSCLLCKIDKIERKKDTGLLHPLPIPERPWLYLLLDFITGLTEAQGYQFVLVVVDGFSKYVVFILATYECPVEEATRLWVGLWVYVNVAFVELDSNSN